MGVKRDLVSGVLYTGIAKYSGIIVQLIITAVLSRILSPNDFGIVAIATVFISFFSILSEVGIGSAIIQNKELTKGDLNSIFTFTIVIGVLLSVLFYFFSSFIGRYYESDVITDVCKYLSLQILFSGFDIVPNALLLKDKRFGLISVRTVSVQIVCGIVAIIVAINGGGLYSLVVSAVLSKFAIFLANYICNPLSLSSDYRCISKIGSYSMYQFLCNMIAYFSRNFDKMFVGKYMHMDMLGYYEKSYRMMMLPLSNITFVFTPVMHPIFSEMQNDVEKIYLGYCKIIKILASVSFPLSLILLFAADDMINLFFGDQWNLSVPPFEILALSVGLQVINSSSGSIFQSVNYTNGLFWVSFISAITQVLGFIVAIVWWNTLEAVAWSFVLTFTANTLLVFYVLFKKLNSSLFKYLQLLVVPFFSSVFTYFLINNYFIISYDSRVASIIYYVLVVSIPFMLVYYSFDYAGIRTRLNAIVLRVLSSKR